MLPALLLLLTVLATVFEILLESHLTTGLSVGRQAPTMPTQTSTPLHMDAGASASGRDGVSIYQFAWAEVGKRSDVQLASWFASFM